MKSVASTVVLSLKHACFSTMTFDLGDRLETHADAKTKLFDYIEVFYNQERRQSTLGYLSPGEFERAARIGQAANC